MNATGVCASFSCGLGKVLIDDRFRFSCVCGLF